MKLRTILLMSLAVMIGGVQADASDWPAFRGVDGSGVSKDKGCPVAWSDQENIVWRTELPGAGSSTPIVVGQRVFLTCYSGYNVPGKPRGQQADLKLHVLCLDRSTGKILWSSDVAPRLPEQESIRDGHGYASSTPVADRERLYVFFGKSGVLAFDHEGKQLWRSDVGSKLNGWGSGASLLLSGKHVIVNASVESGKLYALDTATGQEVWSKAGIRESWNTPILAHHQGRTEVVLAIQGKILGLDPQTGQENWYCATDIPWYMVPSLVAHDGVVYAIGGRPGGGLAVRLGGQGNVTATHRLWTSKKGGNVSSPVYHDGQLYWMHDNLGIAYCADAKTGRVIYEERMPRAGQVYGSAVLADGNVYYPARDGAVFVVAARPTFALKNRNVIAARDTSNASLAIAGSQIFLRTDRFVCCVGKK